MPTMRILVVDDEQDLCEILRFNLETEGFSVDTANSAEEAMSFLRDSLSKHYNLILLDVMMERMSGFEMARQMRASGDNTPIIFLTALGEHDDQLQGFAAGADDYIAKPFAFDAVLARVKAVLRRSNQNALGNHYTPNTLTKREQLIFDLFQQNPGRFFTREEILESVWPDGTLVGERSVDVHIARLRKKMGAEGSRIINKTGYGYGLV
ncbi:MAG: response regulator transcription factor [Bacteroidales bacterium]|nr:response regulator transcription factor [Bacteroidales bacterium]